MGNPPTIKRMGRMNVYVDTRPPAPKAESHISAPVREALKDHAPEIRRGVLDVADRT
jgi:hypothetical protein